MSKRQKRVEEVTKEYEKFVEVTNAEKLYGAKVDEELFVLDRVGSKNARRKLEKTKSDNGAVVIVSATEKKLIQRKQKEIESGALVTSKSKPTNELLDIWGEVSPNTQPTAKSKVGVRKVAVPGMSYNPSASSHQDAIAEVLLHLIYNPYLH
jgi:hypothetical protein